MKTIEVKCWECGIKFLSGFISQIVTRSRKWHEPRYSFQGLLHSRKTGVSTSSTEDRKKRWEKRVHPPVPARQKQPRELRQDADEGRANESYHQRRVYRPFRCFQGTLSGQALDIYKCSCLVISIPWLDIIYGWFNVFVWADYSTT